jgi:hypothetical protein
MSSVILVEIAYKPWKLARRTKTVEEESEGIRGQTGHLIGGGHGFLSHSKGQLCPLPSFLQLELEPFLSSPPKSMNTFVPTCPVF